MYDLYFNTFSNKERQFLSIEKREYLWWHISIYSFDSTCHKLCHPSIYKMNILNACQFPIFVKVSMQLQDIEHPLCLGFLFEKGDYPLDILCFTRKRLS